MTASYCIVRWRKRCRRWAERICLMRFAYQAYKTICSGIKQCLMRCAYQAYKTICSGIKQCLMRYAYQAYKSICSGIKQCLMRFAYQAYKTICSGIRPTYAIYPVGRIRGLPRIRHRLTMPQ